MKTKIMNFLVILVLLIALPLSFAQADENVSEDVNETSQDIVDEGNDINNDTEIVDEEITENESEDVDESEGVDESEEVEEENSEDENVVSENRELAPFKTNHGASVRLLQLERAIHRNILFGELLLDRVDIQNETTLTELETILAALRDLKFDVSNYELVGGEEDVRAFVSYKNESINLAKQFRDNIRVHVQENEQNTLRAQINRELKTNRELNEYKLNLNERSRKHNEEVVMKLADKFNLEAEELIERMRAENITLEEIRTQVFESAKNIREQGRNVVHEMREEALRERIQHREERLKLQAELREENLRRANERVEKVKQNLGDNITEDVRERIGQGLRNRSRI